MRHGWAAIAVVLLAGGVCRAQIAPCGLTSMKETAATIYPAIARAAHVQAAVILMVDFKPDGSVANISVLHAPKLLEANAVTYVRGWQANVYTGPRSCPIVVTYRLLPEESTLNQSVERQDLQHVTISAYRSAIYAINDPAMTIVHDWHWIFWKLKSPFRSHSY